MWRARCAPLNVGPSPPPPGDWFRADKLLREAGGSDAELRDTADKIGAYYSDRHKWGRAASYYAQVRRA